MTFSDSDATRIISALDERLSRRLGNNSMITSTWGEVVDVDAYGKICSVLLYGEADNQYKSEGFRIPEAMVVTPGYNVKVSINNATGERWVEEASVPSTYKKVAIDPVGGTILTGDGTAAPGTPAGSGLSANLLPNGGFSQGTEGWTLSQNGDTTATFAIYDTTNTSWTLRDGDVKGFDASGGPYGSTAYLHSTSTGSYLPYISSDKVPVMAGEKYSVSALLGTHRVTSCEVRVWTYDDAGASTGSFGSGVAAGSGSLTGGPWKANWMRLKIDGMVMPANTVAARVVVIMYTPYTSGTDLYLFVDQVMFTHSASSTDYVPYKSPDVVGEYSVPCGSIVMWPSSSIFPTGWAVCNGQAVSRTLYSQLFGIIGTTFGAGDGSTTFNLPNMNSRSPVGRTAEAIGTTGGASTHTHAGHSNHTVTQPSAHPAVSHSGTAVSAHTGTAVADHAALGTHVHELPFTIDDTTAISSLDTSVFGTGTVRTRDWTAAVTGVNSTVAVAKSQAVSGGTPSAHSVTQPSAHTVTNPSDHASVSHSGTAVDAHSAHDSPSSYHPYMILNFIIKL